MVKNKFDVADILIEPLDQHHERNNFDCGNDPLNHFLQKYARQNMNNYLSKTYVAVNKHDRKAIWGFYSLASGQITSEDFPTTIKHPKYPVSIARIGRLAVSIKYQSYGIGGLLLHDALSKTIKAAELIGIFAIAVDAKDELAKKFYQHYGFIPLKDDGLMLFLPLNTLLNAR